MVKGGIILEGGSTRGIFTSGVLDYLMEQDYYFSYVIGVSAGACNGVDYVAKQKDRTKKCMIPANKETEFFRVKNIWKNKSLFDMNMIFDKYPNEIYPFDFETYTNSKQVCEVVVTNCITGRAQYYQEKNDQKKLMDICRASSSMPLVTPMVEINGIPYLDGGISDSIPIFRAMEQGIEKNVVILTRNKGYRKKGSTKMNAIARRVLEQYPRLVKAFINRPCHYNETLEKIEAMEADGKLYVIRPEIPVISKTERNKQVLEAFYQHGYNKMKANFEEMKRYLQ